MNSEQITALGVISESETQECKVTTEMCRARKFIRSFASQADDREISSLISNCRQSTDHSLSMEVKHGKENY